MLQSVTLTGCYTILNNKGQISDVFYWILILFFISISSIFGLWLINTFNDTAGSTIAPVAQQQLTESAYAFTFADYAYPVAIVLILVALVFTYLYIPSSPILIISEFIVLGFVIFSGMIVSTIYDKVFNSTSFNSTIVYFPLTNIVNNNFAVIGGVIGLVVLLTYFMKRGDNGGQVI